MQVSNFPHGGLGHHLAKQIMEKVDASLFTLSTVRVNLPSLGRESLLQKNAPQAMKKLQGLTACTSWIMILKVTFGQNQYNHINKIGRAYYCNEIYILIEIVSN